MPQQDDRPLKSAQPIADELQKAFQPVEDLDEETKKKKVSDGTHEKLVSEANQSFSDNPDNLSDAGKAARAKQGFMAKAMAKKPAPAAAPAPSTNAARNRYGSIVKRVRPVN